MAEVLRFEGDEVVASEVQSAIPLVSPRNLDRALRSASEYLSQRFPDARVLVAAPTTTEVQLLVLGRTSGWTQRQQILKRVREISEPGVVYISPGRSGPRTGHVVLEGEETPFPMRFERSGEPRNVVLSFPARIGDTTELAEGKYAVVPRTPVPRKLLGPLAEVVVHRGRTAYVRIPECDPYRTVHLVARRDGAPVNLVDVKVWVGGESVTTLHGVELRERPLLLPVNAECRVGVRRIRGPWREVVVPIASDASPTTLFVDLE